MTRVEFFGQHNKLHIPNFTVQIFAKKKQTKKTKTNKKQKKNNVTTLWLYSAGHMTLHKWNDITKHLSNLLTSSSNYYLN